MEFKESQTKINLARSFSAECQAGARYQFMSKMALQNQMQYISDTLKTLAKNEMAHAKAFYDLIIENCNGNCDNIAIEAGYPFDDPNLETSLLKEADIEIYEATNIYPAFAKIAYDEGFSEIGKLFELVANVEEHHHYILNYIGKLYTKNSLYKRPNLTKWKCSNCGYTETKKECWKTCPLCKLPDGYAVINLDKIEDKDTDLE